MIATVCELLKVPTSTLPKVKLVALDVRWNVCAVPVPDNAIVVGEFVALLTIVTLPVTPPAIVGEKLTVKVALCPAGKASGTAKPPAVNPAPDTTTCEMLTVLLPVFVSTANCELLPATSMLPRLNDVVVAESKHVDSVEEVDVDVGAELSRSFQAHLVQQNPSHLRIIGRRLNMGRKKL